MLYRKSTNNKPSVKQTFWQWLSGLIVSYTNLHKFSYWCTFVKIISLPLSYRVNKQYKILFSTSQGARLENVGGNFSLVGGIGLGTNLLWETM